MALSQIQTILGISGIVSLVLNVIFIAILIKWGKPVWERLKATRMKNPTYIIRIYNKTRADMELVDFTDGIVKFGKKTYVKDPERIIRHKPFDMAFFMAEDCRPLNLADVELILDPEVYTRQLELAEMAGAARMVERLVEELMKALTPYLIAIVGAVVLVLGGFFVIHKQGAESLGLIKAIYNTTVIATKAPLPILQV